jgi:hypothetical protein
LKKYLRTLAVATTKENTLSPLQTMDLMKEKMEENDVKKNENKTSLCSVATRNNSFASLTTIDQIVDSLSLSGKNNISKYDDHTSLSSTVNTALGSSVINPIRVDFPCDGLDLSDWVLFSKFLTEGVVDKVTTEGENKNVPKKDMVVTQDLSEKVNKLPAVKVENSRIKKASKPDKIIKLRLRSIASKTEQKKEEGEIEEPTHKDNKSNDSFPLSLHSLTPACIAYMRSKCLYDLSAVICYVGNDSGMESISLGKGTTQSKNGDKNGDVKAEVSSHVDDDKEKHDSDVEIGIPEGKGMYVAYVRGECEILKRRLDELKKGNGMFKNGKDGLIHAQAENYNFVDSVNTLSYPDVKPLAYKEQKYHHALPDVSSSYASDVISEIVDKIAKRIYKSRKGFKQAEKFPPSLWFRMDDTHVSVCSFHDIRKSQVYANKFKYLSFFSFIRPTFFSMEDDFLLWVIISILSL